MCKREPHYALFVVHVSSTNNTPYESLEGAMYGKVSCHGHVDIRAVATCYCEYTALYIFDMLLLENDTRARCRNVRGPCAHRSTF